MPKGRVGSMRKEDAAYRRYLKAEAKREKAQMAALRRADARRNPARGGRKFGLTVAQIKKLAGAGAVRLKKVGKQIEVYIRRKARRKANPAKKRVTRAPAKRKTAKRRKR